MKVEAGTRPAAAAPEMEAAAAEEEAAERVCGNCKRAVAEGNFSLHEAHCRRFLAVCSECEEPVARRDMQAHRGEAHQQVRCQLCHQAMQQYLLQQHQAEECPERPAQCRFCELELPFRQLQRHLGACGSRTTSCLGCGKYVMLRALEDHQRACQAGGGGPSAPAEPQGKLCQLCGCQFPDEQYLQHLNECAPLPQLLGALSTGPPPKRDPAPEEEEEQDVRPRRPEREVPALVGKPSLKPPKGRRAFGRLAFTPQPPSAQGEAGQAEDPYASSYEQMAACPRCNILLPCPTLERHQKKCLRRQVVSGQARRRSPRLSGRRGSHGHGSPPRETSDQL